MSPPARAALGLWPAAGLVAAAALALTPAFETLERGWMDTSLRWLAEPWEVRQTLVVDIDDSSMRALRQRGDTWPFRRDLHADVAERLLAQGARAVVFNLSFSDAREGDAALQRLARAEPGRLVFGGHMRRDAAVDAGTADVPATAGRWQVPGGAPAAEWSSWAPPTPNVLPPQPRIGVLQTRLDSDGRLRCATLLHRAGDAVLPSLVLAALSAGRPLPVVTVDDAAPGLAFDRQRWPIDRQGCVALRLPRQADAVPVLSYAEVALAAPAVTPDWAHRVRDRTVFIGSPSVLDGQALTPLGQVGGTVWHAMAHEALLAQRVVQPHSTLADATLAMLAAVPVLAGLRRRTPDWRLDLRESLAAALAVLLLVALLLGVWTQPSALPLALLVLGCGLLVQMARWQHWLSGQRAMAQLDQARAEAASRARTEFLAHMSHEIRTPLNALLGVAQLLDETPLTPLQKRYVDVFNRSGTHLRQLVDDVLDITRIEAGHLTLQTEVFSLATLADEISGLFGSRAQAKGLEFSTELDAALPPWVSGDRRRLQQVLVNLLGNACKFTEQGSVSLRMRAGPEPDRVEFVVRDTGIGVPAAQLQRIFEPFAQADAGVARRFGGSGLGLAITQRLVGAMGGVVTLSSVEQRGTEVTLVLPLPRWAGEPPRAEPTPSLPDASALLAGCRILLAEDNDHNVLVVEGMLQGSGVELVRAHDGQAAIELAGERQPDLILMDLQMPRLGGLAATRAIRDGERRAGHRPVPIIALSANALPADVDASLAAGCNAHLGKPFAKADLLRLLERYRGEAGRRQAPRPEVLEREAALARLGGDVETYERVLVAARAQWQDWPARYQDGLAGGDPQRLHRLVHDLKSTAATVGATRLSAAAAALEAALREGRDPQPAHAAVTEALRDVLDGA